MNGFGIDPPEIYPPLNNSGFVDVVTGESEAVVSEPSDKEGQEQTDCKFYSVLPFIHFVSFIRLRYIESSFCPTVLMSRPLAPITSLDEWLLLFKTLLVSSASSSGLNVSDI